MARSPEFSPVALLRVEVRSAGIRRTSPALASMRVLLPQALQGNPAVEAPLVAWRQPPYHLSRGSVSSKGAEVAASRLANSLLVGRPGYRRGVVARCAVKSAALGAASAPGTGGWPPLPVGRRRGNGGQLAPRPEFGAWPLI